MHDHLDPLEPGLSITSATSFTISKHGQSIELEASEFCLILNHLRLQDTVAVFNILTGEYTTDFFAYPDPDSSHSMITIAVNQDEYNTKEREAQALAASLQATLQQERPA